MGNLTNHSETSKKYDLIAQFLHWSMALILVYLIFFSHFEDLADDVMTSNIKIHSGLGLLIILLGIIRWHWRQSHGVPSVPGPKWQKTASKFVHLAFYSTFIISPLVGIILAGLVSYPVSVFGFIEISGWLSDNDSMAKIINSVHGFTADVLLALLVLHVGAALYHHFIKRDGLIWLILPIGR